MYKMWLVHYWLVYLVLKLNCFRIVFWLYWTRIHLWLVEAMDRRKCKIPFVCISIPGICVTSQPKVDDLSDRVAWRWGSLERWLWRSFGVISWVKIRSFVRFCPVNTPLECRHPAISCREPYLCNVPCQLIPNPGHWWWLPMPQDLRHESLCLWMNNHWECAHQLNNRIILCFSCISYPLSINAIFPSISSTFRMFIHPSSGSVMTNTWLWSLKLLSNVPPKSLASRSRYVYCRSSGSTISKKTSLPMISGVETPSYVCRLLAIWKSGNHISTHLANLIQLGGWVNLPPDEINVTSVHRISKISGSVISSPNCIFAIVVIVFLP